MLSENVQSDSYRPLEQIDDRISPNRESAVACYLTGRSYPCGTVELAAIKLTKGDQLRKGGGAKRKNDDKSEMDKVTLTKSASRATKVIRQRALAMGADRMLTLTFHDNVSGIDEAWSCFNLSGFNSPQLAAICFKGERSEGKNRVIPRQLAAGIAIFSLAVFIAQIRFDKPCSRRFGHDGLPTTPPVAIEVDGRDRCGWCRSNAESGRKMAGS